MASREVLGAWALIFEILSFRIVTVRMTPPSVKLVSMRNDHASQHEVHTQGESPELDS